MCIIVNLFHNFLYQKLPCPSLWSHFLPCCPLLILILLHWSFCFWNTLNWFHAGAVLCTWKCFLFTCFFFPSHLSSLNSNFTSSKRPSLTIHYKMATSLCLVSCILFSFFIVLSTIANYFVNLFTCLLCVSQWNVSLNENPMIARTMLFLLHALPPAPRIRSVEWINKTRCSCTAVCTSLMEMLQK